MKKNKFKANKNNSKTGMINSDELIDCLALKAGSLQSLLTFAQLAFRLLQYEYYHLAAAAVEDLSTQRKISLAKLLGKDKDLESVSILDYMPLYVGIHLVPFRNVLIIGYNYLQNSDKDYISDINFENEEDLTRLGHTFEEYITMNLNDYYDRILKKNADPSFMSIYKKLTKKVNHNENSQRT